jgi:glucose-fructose oxidoreductase
MASIERSQRPASARTARRRVRYAVVGLGYISQIATLPAFANARRNSELAALVSDDPEKLELLGAKYRVDNLYPYDAFAECLRNVDAVYLGLPNHLHAEYTEAAAAAGVHVLCEKPLAVTEEQCERMIAACADAGVLLMTAYRLHFERANLRAIELAQSGELGELRFFEAAFSMQVREDNIRLQSPALGGGPIYDIGIYCINAARQLFRAEPDEVIAFDANSGEQRFRDTHEMMSCLLRFPGERLASFTCSAGAADLGWYEIVGTRGRLRVDPAYEFAGSLKHALTVGGRTRKTTYPRRDQFAPELLYFSDCILRQEKPEPSGREGQADVRVIRALLKSARRGQPIQLGDFERRQRATPDMEIRRPPVAEPELVHAEKPSAD